MILGIFIAMLAASWFGVPLLLIFVLSAILQAAIAWVLTKNPVCINAGTGVGIVAASYYLILPMLLSGSSDASLPVSPGVLTALTWASAIIGLVTSTLIGMLGSPGGGKAGGT